MDNRGFSEKGHNLQSFDNSLQVPTNNMGDSRRGSNYSLYKLNKTERAAIKHEQEIDETLHVTSLTHVLQVPVEKKDFSKEIRATKDIKDFVEKSEVLLDLREDTLEPIVDRLLEVIFDNNDEETVTKQELKSSIFTDDSKINLKEKLQGIVAKHGDDIFEYEQTWICCPVTIPTLNKRHVGIARLRSNVNLGAHAEEIRFFILVLCPSDVKVTKTSLETARTFGTVFSDLNLRHNLLTSTTVTEFKAHILVTSNEFANHQQVRPDITMLDEKLGGNDDEDFKWYHVGKGIMTDVMGRLPYYFDDFKDGIMYNGKINMHTIQKTIATTLFLYFSVILPAIALGVLNAKTTENAIGVHQVIVGQTIGALAFALFSGQPLVVVMTTAPLALFNKIIWSIAKSNGLEGQGILAFYAAVGLWNTFFVCIYAFFNMSKLMKFSSRSTEEIFSNFITIAFIKDSTTVIVETFQDHYWKEECIHPAYNHNNTSMNSTATDYYDEDVKCDAGKSFLSVILMLGTLWLGVTLFNFKKTPFLSRPKREILSDYALPVAVVVFSLIGSIGFSPTKVKYFKYSADGSPFKLVAFETLTVETVCLALVLGFSLSLLFFMDQNISAAMVDSPDNKLVKGNAYHWDLLLIALINGVLCIFGLPFMHAVLPHSPLHVKCLADTEERVESGHVKSIVVYVRETRLTNLFSNILIGVSMFFLVYVLKYIPTPVLDGLFLYLAVTALFGNQMFERILLFFMEKSAYPPNHYIRKVPEQKMHTFTLCQIVQLGILCAFGFNSWAYAKMIFPVVLFSFLPMRRLLIPKIIEKKYLDVLDG